MSRHSEANDPWGHGPVAYAKQEADEAPATECWCCGTLLEMDERALCQPCADARCDEQDKPGNAHGRRKVPCPRCAK